MYCLKTCIRSLQISKFLIRSHQISSLFVQNARPFGLFFIVQYQQYKHFRHWQYFAILLRRRTFISIHYLLYSNENQGIYLKLNKADNMLATGI